MTDLQHYVATADVAQRSGMIATRYRLVDGTFILNNRDLRGIRMTSEEMLTGIKGITPISEKDAIAAIADNGYKLGMEQISDNGETLEDVGLATQEGTTNEESPIEEESPAEDEVQEESEQNEETSGESEDESE